MPGSRRHNPRKRFGQNFLHDAAVIERILSAFAPRPADTVVEIGPGQGALTEPLLEHLETLDVVEVDRDLGADLSARFPAERCRVHIGDALEFNFAALATAPRSLRVIGNLPYNVSTPLIFHLLEQLAWIRDLHFMLQKEVVDRMCALPGCRDYGRLSIMLQLHCRCERLFPVSARSFHPVPRVESAVIRLTPHPRCRIDGSTLAALKPMLLQVFSRRRKTLRNSLRGIMDTLEIERCGIDPGVRPEQLSVDDFIRLAQHLAQAGNISEACGCASDTTCG